MTKLESVAHPATKRLTAKSITFDDNSVERFPKRANKFDIINTCNLPM